MKNIWGRPRAHSLAIFVTAVATPALFFVLGVPAEAMGDAGLQHASVTSVSAVAQAVRAEIPSGAVAIERGHVQAALVKVHAIGKPLTADWTLTPGTTMPRRSGDFSVAFDNGQNVTSGLPNEFGSRVAILTVLDNGSGFAGAVETLNGRIVTCSVNPDINTAAALLAAVGPTLTCPNPAQAVTHSSAITTLWAWGNSVDPAVDNRGLGQAGMSPGAIAEFAGTHGISTVYLAVPWASNQGAIGDWLSATVSALHARGIRVAALGGDAGWLAQPGLGAEWAADAFLSADFDAVELDIEPWAGVANPDFATITPQLMASIAAIRAASSGHPVGADLPWWLATTNFGVGSVFSAVASQLDSVAIVAFSDHAAGSDGIVQLASPAVSAAESLHLPFTIGVETDTPAVAGGAQFTFYDTNTAKLVTETDKVRAAFAHTSGYRGVAVEHLLSWSALIARG